MSEPKKIVRIGSRKSQLALTQTNLVETQLKYSFPHYTFDIVCMSTIGDKILDKALSKIGEKSLFTKELEIALEKNEVDLVVHSLKDLPTVLPRGMVIGAVLQREDPNDALVLKSGSTYRNLSELPPGSVVGTSSLRRTAQLQKLYPDLKFQSVRGNLNTRLSKLDNEENFCALILAVAGLKRLNLEHRISQILDSECLYAVGQGALAVECRSEDTATLSLIAHLSHIGTAIRCVAERAFMKTLEGGCSVPVAVSSEIVGQKLSLKGGVFNLDGSKSLVQTLTCCLPTFKSTSVGEIENMNSYCGIVVPHIHASVLTCAEQLGVSLANNMINQGAAEILRETRQCNSANGSAH